MVEKENLRDCSTILKHIARESVGSVYYYSFTRFFARGGIRILVYHYVDKEDVKNFREQMLYLKREGYQCLGLESLPLYLSGKIRSPRRAFVLTFDDGFKDNYFNVFPVIKEFGFNATFFLVYDFIGTLRRYWWDAKRPLLSWEEVKEMKRYGLSFGSHTLTHANLLTLSGDAVNREIWESKVRLEDKIGAPVKFFSYPYGFWNESIVELVRRSGYTGACSIRYGISSSIEECFKLCRINIEPQEPLERFRKKISGSFDWLKRFSLKNKPLYRVD